MMSLDRVFLVCLVFVAYAAPVSSAEGQPETPAEEAQTLAPLSRREWRPETTAEGALALAKAYIQAQKIDISSHFLVDIKMDATWKTIGTHKILDQSFWTLIWAKPAADSRDCVVLCVSMDGKNVRRVDATPDVVGRGRLSKAPEITFERAMQIAGEYTHRENIDMSVFTLYKVTLVDSRGYWYFWWTHVGGALGHYVQLTVSMDGKVRRLASM